ncbi:potassium channel family protein [Blastopirellula sp. J2-11]|uniref:potassium channel family protein n=1 Tax=Blastopirellula sp. J2-11 TaxID=2943192 RepID=UPI0021C718DA|nr:potassium channel family protein [Blastopirellula sp. J2-11]UUO07092.1 potassium channel family protein [Blastopirellula sp. J2-11]
MSDAAHLSPPETSRHWLIRHRHAVTLIALILLMAGETLRPDSSTGNWISDLLLSIVILAAAYDVLIRHRRFLLVALSAVPPIATIWIIRGLDEFRDVEMAAEWYLLRNVLMIAFLSYIVWVIGRDVSRAKRVTTDQVLGGVSVYLLLGLIWAIAYLSVVMFDSSAIEFSTPDDGLAGRRLAALIYFSFATLTTLGLGDILPLSNLARTLTWTEAVTGQLYIAVSMAKLVGLRLVHLTQPPKST